MVGNRDSDTVVKQNAALHTALMNVPKNRPQVTGSAEAYYKSYEPIIQEKLADGINPVPQPTRSNAI